MQEQSCYPSKPGAQLTHDIENAIAYFATLPSEDKDSQIRNHCLLEKIESGKITPSDFKLYCQIRSIDTICFVDLPGLRLFQITYGQPPSLIEFEITTPETA